MLDIITFITKYYYLDMEITAVYEPLFSDGTVEVWFKTPDRPYGLDYIWAANLPEVFLCSIS